MLTYDLDQFEWINAYFLLSDFTLTLLALEFFILGIRWFNKKYPWSAGIQKRLAYQLIFLSPVLLLFIIVTNEIVELIYYTGRIGFSFYTFDLLLITVYVFLIQFIYLSFHFMGPRSEDEIVFNVFVGKNRHLLKQDEIIVVYVIARLTYFLDTNGKSYLSNETLSDIENKLPGNFIRANRQMILSRKAVKSFTSDTHGKIQVSLHCENDRIPNPITISRIKAAQFRKWIKQ